MEKFVAFAAIAAFYAIYFQRQFALRRRGIDVARLGRGVKERRTLRTERCLIAVSVAMPPVQVASIVRGEPRATALWVAGAVVAFAGVAFFLAAVVAMRENWRAGVDASQHTDLVTRGVYRLSRNPAFVGFDLFYIGIAVMFPNPALVALTVAAIVIFHLQIVEEERYMHSVFGESYARYAGKTRRYL